MLIRALDPLEGIDVMRRRRARAMKGRRTLPIAAALPTHELCRGPGNLTMAMGITLAENRLDLLGDRLFIEDRGIRVGADRLGAADRHQGRDRAAVAGMGDGHPAVSEGP